VEAVLGAFSPPLEFCGSGRCFLKEQIFVLFKSITQKRKHKHTYEKKRKSTKKKKKASSFMH
jgi:hypothetical protein